MLEDSSLYVEGEEMPHLEFNKTDDNLMALVKEMDQLRESCKEVSRALRRLMGVVDDPDWEYK